MLVEHKSVQSYPWGWTVPATQHCCQAGHPHIDGTYSGACAERGLLTPRNPLETWSEFLREPLAVTPVDI